MKVIICGAGQVGYGIAERLSAEGNDVSVIDTSRDLVQRVNDMLEARGIQGHGSYPDVLAAAGAQQADMLIAVTLHDEVNMVACEIAKALFDVPTCIARVRAQNYLLDEYSELFKRDNIPIDLRISPEIEVGEMVLRRLSQPGAFENVSFGDGRISAVGVSCKTDCPVLDTPLRQLSELFPDLPAAIVGVVRDGRVFVPHGEDQLIDGDDAYFIAPRDQVTRTLKIFGHNEEMARRVVIAGGGNIGLFVARRLEESFTQARTKIVELNRSRALEIAENLNRTVVLHGSSLSEELLMEADVGTADVLIALTNDDQVNILTCVLARQLGCQRNLCLINSSNYANVVRSLGIDAQVNPRAITVSRILQLVRRGRIRGVHEVQNGLAEILEADVLETAPIAGRPLRDLNLPDGVRIGAVLRDKAIIMPDGDTELRNRDRVVLFSTQDNIRDVEQLFTVGLEYF